jgi:hypothetical protein
MEKLNFLKLKISVIFGFNLLNIFFYLQNISLQPFQLTYGVFLGAIKLCLIYLIPVLVPLFFNKIVFRWIAFIVSIVIAVINVGIGVVFAIDGQIQYGLFVIIIFGSVSILGAFSIYKWIKYKA